MWDQLTDQPANRKNPKSVRWSAVRVAPKSVLVGCDGERGSGPKGANDACFQCLVLNEGV